MAPKQSKLLALLNYRLKVTVNDSRVLVGQMLAFDQHMNLVLADCEEFRFVKQKKKKASSAFGGASGVGLAGPAGIPNTGPGEEAVELEMKRTLGLVILRGETIVSLSVEGPPPVQQEEKGPGLAPGAGRGMPAGRGMGIVPPSGAPPPAFRGGPSSFPPGPPGGMPGMPPPGFSGPPGFGGPPPQFAGGPPQGFPGGPPPFPGAPPGFGQPGFGPPR